MKVLALILTLMALTASAAANTYTSSFSSTQNPLSDGGKWLNGGANGVDWTNCQTSGGMVYGTMSGTATGNAQWDDSTCVLAGSWGPNQTASATVKVPGSTPWGYKEVELRLNTSISGHNITGYEFNCSVQQGNNYMTIVRWNGALGSFTTLGSNFNQYCKSGDVLQATSNNGNLKFYKNGQLIVSAADTFYSGGAPGMGFFIQDLSGSQYNSTFGLSGFSATDGGSSSSSSSDASAGSASVTLRYGQSSSSVSGDAGSVTIYRATIASGGSCSAVKSWTVLTTSAPLSGTYVDNSVQNGQVYCYGAVFVRDGLSSPLSQIFKASPPTTTGVAVGAPAALTSVTGFTGSVQ